MEIAKYLDWAKEALSESSTKSIENDAGFLRLLGLYRMGRGHLAALRGQLESARTHLNEALAISDQIKDDRLRGSVLNSLGFMLLLATDYPAAQRSFAASIATFERLGDVEQRLEALSGFAISKSFDVKELERASRWLLAVGQNSPLAKGYAYSTLAICYTQLGLLGHAENHFLRSIKNLDKAGDRSQQARSLSFLGTAYAYQRQFDKAEEWCARGLEMAGNINVFAELAARSSMVPILLHRGDDEKAEAIAKYVLELSKKSDNKLHISVAYQGMGSIDQHCGRIDSAANNYQQAHDLFKTIGYRFRQAESGAELASCFLKLGRKSEAQAIGEQILAICREDNLRNPTWKAAAVMAQCLISEGKIEQARQYLDIAKQAIDEMVADLPGEVVGNFLADKQFLLDLYRQYEKR
jgi:tetratricopeptide (TPR) repeat protein